MAKSLRSKWRRKCRAVKRVRYGKKELDRLKKTLGIDGDEQVAPKVDLSETDLNEIATVTTAQEIKDKIDADHAAEEEMECDSGKRKFNSRTLKDQNGAYPVWVHPRKIRKVRKGIKKGGGGKGKNGKPKNKKK